MVGATTANKDKAAITPPAIVTLYCRAPQVPRHRRRARRARRLRLRRHAAPLATFHHRRHAARADLEAELPREEDLELRRERVDVDLGLYPVVTFQYSSTTLYQVSYHIR